MRDLRHFGSHKLDLNELTVYHEKDGELHDLNANGDPIDNLEELRDFVRTLGSQEAFGKMRENRMVRAVDTAIEYLDRN